MRAHIRVSATTSLGQVVAVALSNTPSISKHSVIELLVTTPDSYPVWYTKAPLVLPMGQITYYRYCIMEGNYVSAFEVLEDGQTRSIKGTDQTDVLIEDKFQTSNAEEADHLSTEKKLLKKLADFARTEKEIESKDSFAIEDIGKLFITCYHLPVIVKRQFGAGDEPFSIIWDDSLISKSADSISNNIGTFWVGTVTVDFPQLTSYEETVLTELLAKLKCIPIFLEPSVARYAYHGFCKEIMWPIFHNVDQLDHIHAAWNLSMTEVHTKIGCGKENVEDGMIHQSHEVKWKGNEGKYYLSYESVSKTFESKLSMLVSKNDVVWVHDYHLMLLPKLLRDREMGIKIVFFLHIPFPTSQIFRSLPKATQLLQSMTCSDIIGFHAFDHTRHFLNATKRILGVRSQTLDGGLLALKVQDRQVIVTMSHVSVEPERLDRILSMVEVKSVAMQIRQKYQGKKIIVGVDTCHRLSGVSLKLAAFDKLLSDYSTTGSDVVLLQRCLRPQVRHKDEETTSIDIKMMVDRMNNKFGQCETLKTK